MARVSAHSSVRSLLIFAPKVARIFATAARCGRVLLCGAWLAAGLGGSAVAEGIRPQDLAAGRILAHSVSPDKKYCFLEVFGGESASVVMAKTNRTEKVGTTPIATVYSSNQPYRGRTAIHWTPDSSRVAIYDTLGWPQKMAIRRLAGGEFEEVTIPDLLGVACKKWGVRRDRVQSSTERPLRWAAEDVLSVEIIANFPAGGRRTETMYLKTPKNGAIWLTEKPAPKPPPEEGKPKLK